MNSTLFTVTTPDGPFTVISTLTEPREAQPAGTEPTSSVLASGWTADPSELIGQIHPTLRARFAPESAQRLDSTLTKAPDQAGLRAIREAIEAFYADDFEPIRRVPVLQHSGEFRTHAWDVLRTVAPGHPVTYSEYALLAGRPAAVRAAAGACALNAAALFVPCHRVVRLDGGLGGFRWGVPVKESLLAREARAAGLSML
ncbi:methylated-DNA--[protein]-cysteine S-methyltransferase [Psychromicrobium xiongbiense]|uniref:methylated-DNA--[protein]-cysteine S-methyltransferase n=1 Tax=Psychromicrobium xiongbiense TaxID=3051184 RepID=UPI0025523A94|nr:methylated-DNA--[protein]-cysteine S-methyltransferase [Psychromicrobium sp. YIM S02556]